MKRISQLFSIGIVSGFVLAGFLKVVEQITDKSVYVLLLNIDYFPVIGNWELHEAIEVGLHLIVSIILVSILYFMFSWKNIQSKLFPYAFVNVLIGVLLFGTTILSSRTPDLTDLLAFILWTCGHLLYGITSWLLIIILIEKRNEIYEAKKEN